MWSWTHHVKGMVLPHKTSRGHPSPGQSYVAYHWTEPLRPLSAMHQCKPEAGLLTWQGKYSVLTIGLWVIPDLHRCGWEQSQPHAAPWPGLSWAEFPWSRPKSRLGFSSSYHLLEVVHSAAKLLEHESLESCFCTWENREYQGYLPGLLSHLTRHVSLQRGQPRLPAEGRSACMPPRAHFPVFAVSSSDPRASAFQASLECNSADIATNKCFSLLLEFNENSFQNFEKNHQHIYI